MPSGWMVDILFAAVNYTAHCSALCNCAHCNRRSVAI